MADSHSHAWLHVVLGCCTAPVIAGALVHRHMQQWLGIAGEDDRFWQDKRLPTLDRPVSSSVHWSSKERDGEGNRDGADAEAGLAETP